MHCNKILLKKMEDWVTSKVPKGYKAVWIDASKEGSVKLDCAGYDAYEEAQSNVLKHICIKNNISYEIYSMPATISDYDRLQEYAKFINWKSQNYNTILFSKILKEQLYFGEYKKYGKDSLDFYPFSDLNKSRVDSLLNYINTNENISSFPINSLLEWLYYQDIQFKIVSSNTSPTKHQRWGTYSLEQKAIIAKYYALIKERDHKINLNKNFNYEF